MPVPDQVRDDGSGIQKHSNQTKTLNSLREESFDVAQDREPVERFIEPRVKPGMTFQ